MEQVMRKIYSLLAVVFFMVIAGCSNSSDSTPPPLSSEKAITQFSLDGVVGIIDETEKTIAVSLSAGSSVTALVATFTTSGAIVTVDSIVQISGETDNDFTSPVVYTVTAADNSSQDYTVTVKAWGITTLIETDNAGDAKNPQVAVDASGNAVAVWSQYDDIDWGFSIWSNRYTAGTGWGTATLIDTDMRDAYDPQVAVDASGNAVAVWSQDDGSRNNIWSNRYSTSTGWGTATLIETDNVGGAGHPQVAINASGNAVAVWSQSDGTRNNIWSNRYTTGTGWGTASLIETDNKGSAGYPQVAVDASGNAVAVWYQYDGTRNNIWSNNYTAGTGWGTAIMIETDNVGWAYYPQVSMNASGNAVAVWYQGGGMYLNIWANCYTAGIGWGTATLIETDNAGFAIDPQVAVDASGNAVAVWSQADGMNYNLCSNNYTPLTGWGTATLIETNNEGWATYPQVAMDASGNAVAVWSQDNAVAVSSQDDATLIISTWSNIYIAGTGWGTATLIETDMGHTFDPQVAIDASGNAVAVWYHYDGMRYNIRSNTYR
jgi:hypothetical protein